jgi:hypothetical protein
MSPTATVPYALTNSGGYFAARFGNDRHIPAGEECQDKVGTSIYFLE